MKRILLITFILLSASVFSQTRQREKYYQDKFAEVIKGTTEFVLEDKTRVDIITETHAIEVDFAEKWAESIGQSLYYGEMSGKKAGVLLVIKGREDERYLDRLIPIAVKHGIDVWIWDWTNDTWGSVDYKIGYLY